MSLPLNNARLKTEEELSELCRLLTTLSPAELQDLRERIENPNIRAVQVSEVIADAVRISSNKNDKLGSSLSPIVTDAVHNSIRKNPEQLSSILAPVMGPAIRASIANALRDYTSSIDRMVQHSVSSKGLGWRLEALRTGKSFAEIVLYHTLEYRVEHVFLINESDGLLISHLSNSESETDAPDAVSGMLTAIYDFVNDSFKVDSEDRNIGQMRIGDLSVLVSKTENALLAAVIRGEVPSGFRAQLSETLESFEFEYEEELKKEELDTSKFAPFDERLIELLQIKLKHASSKEEKKNKWLKPLVMGLAAMLALRFLFINYLENRSWNTFLNYLDDKPGIVVTSVDTEGSYHNVKGLRDPLAVNPQRLYQRQDFYEDGNISFNFKSFQSLEHEIVRRRVKKKFNPPKEVLFDVDSNGILTVGGVASKEWIDNFNGLAQEIVGVNKVDSSNLKISSLGKYQETVNAIQDITINFSISEDLETELFEDEHKEMLDKLATLIREFNSLAEVKDSKATVFISSYLPKNITEDVPTARLFAFRNKIYSEILLREVPSFYLSLVNNFDQPEACERFPALCKKAKPFVYFNVKK